MASDRSLAKSLLWLLLTIVANDVYAQGISWQDAVATLADERTRAESCVAVLKKYADTDATARGAITYGAAKAEFDSVIAGLSVALARGEQSANVGELTERLLRGDKDREALCQFAVSLIPGSAGQKEKGLVGDLLGSAIEPLITAAKEIDFKSLDQKALTRKTIQTQLEATKWSAFNEIALFE